MKKKEKKKGERKKEKKKKKGERKHVERKKKEKRKFSSSYFYMEFLVKEENLLEAIDREEEEKLEDP